YGTMKPLAARFQAEGKKPEWEDYFRELPPEFRAKVDRHSRALLVGDLVKQIGGGVERYYLKAMNCPHHHKLSPPLPRSYRDLPLPLGAYGTGYRHEKSGELRRLTRPRWLHTNDGHMSRTPDHS